MDKSKVLLELKERLYIHPDKDDNIKPFKFSDIKQVATKSTRDGFYKFCIWLKNNQTIDLLFFVPIEHSTSSLQCEFAKEYDKWVSELNFVLTNLV